MQRVMVETGQVQEGSICLTESQVHYLRRVLRLGKGDRFVALDGRGRGWVACLEGEVGVARVVEDWLCDRELPIPVHLVIAMPKSGMDDVVRQATELGVSSILPVVSDRTVLKPSEKKVERWRRIAQEAMEQCERQWVPRVEEPVGVGEVWEGRRGEGEGERQKVEGRRQKGGGRRQKVEGRRQKGGEGRQKGGEGRQKGEGRGQEGEGGRQKVEGRRREGEGGRQKVEGRRQKGGEGRQKVEGRGQKGEGRGGKIEGVRWICVARDGMEGRGGRLLLGAMLERMGQGSALAQPKGDGIGAITIAVGPEGGWTAAEVEMAMAVGYEPVSLGPRILRAVTAPLGAIAIVAAVLDYHGYD